MSTTRITHETLSRYAVIVSDKLHGGLHVKVNVSGFSGQYFIELHDNNGRVEDLFLTPSAPAVMDYLSAMHATLNIVGR